MALKNGFAKPVDKEDIAEEYVPGPMGLKIVPWNTPLKDRLEELSVALNIFLTVFGATLGPIVCLIIIFFTDYWYLVVLYIGWIYLDRRTGFEGGRTLYWFRRLKMFEYFRSYFPISLIKTADLPSDKNYLLVQFPHGVLPYSVLANFGSEANKVSELYPGVDMRVITLNLNFYCPVTREYFLSFGACGAGESSILHLLNSKPSTGVVLIAGGAAESLLASPGSTYRIVVNRRKGFVRIALKTGVSLVPVFSFGENNAYEQYQGKWIAMIQGFLYKLTGAMLVFPKGRGFFQYNFGLLPRRRPINTVVGAPIPVPKIENPSKEQIDEYHRKFREELIKLFEENKHKYDSPDATLIMA